MSSDQVHICTLCGSAGDVQGCAHRGSWHSSTSDCSLRCAWKLGWSRIGYQHWSCCYSTDRDQRCPKLVHTFEPSREEASDPEPREATAASHMFIKSDCPRYVVNLDEKPEKRWTGIVEAYKDRLPAALELIDQVLGGGFLAGAADLVLAGLTKAGRVYYGRELKGIAKAAGISLGKVAILQVAYEVFAACTSIVCDTSAADDGDRKVPFHIRTMDWEMEALQQLTVEVEFVRGGRPVFVATTWPGYVGVLTGMKKGAFAVSINYRRTFRGSQNMLKGVLENMYRGLAMCWPVSFLVREALESCSDYREAVAALSASDLMGPSYVIVSGVAEGQGVVISRERKGDASLPLLDLAEHGPLVQANMDHWRGVLAPEIAYASNVDAEAADDSGDWQDICCSRERRAVAKAAIARRLEEQGRVLPEDLWLVLSTPPCLAEDTVYTVGMCAATGLYCTRRQVTREQRAAAASSWGGLATRVCREVRRVVRSSREAAGRGDAGCAEPRRQ